MIQYLLCQLGGLRIIYDLIEKFWYYDFLFIFYYCYFLAWVLLDKPLSENQIVIFLTTSMQFV